jgi:hypothetical protein
MGGRTVMAVSKNSSPLSLNRPGARRQGLRARFSGWHKRRFASPRVGRLERNLNNGYKGDARYCSSRGMPMPTKRTATAKKSARTRKLSAVGEKAPKTRKLKAAGTKAAITKERRAAAWKAAATKKPPTAAAELQVVPTEVPPAAAAVPPTTGSE